jgi:hypothetical protein
LSRPTDSTVNDTSESHCRGHGRQGRRLLGHRLLVSLVLSSLALQTAVSAQPAEADAAAIEAAMLRNFAHYITWPSTAFASDKSPWRLCVLGPDPFGSLLERTVGGRTEQGRGFSVVRAADPAALTACHMVFIAATETSKRRAALAAWQGLPILTVSDAPSFLQEGGAIRLDIGDRVELSVNLDQARALSLKVQTKLLEVAREVLDNGSLRRRR